MPFHLKISKKGDAQYAQIVETVYDPAVKRGVSRAVESFGNLTKLRLKNPLIDEQIAAKLEELNRNGKLAQQVKFERLAHKLPYAASVTADNCGVNVLNYGTAFYRKVWEDLSLDLLFLSFYFLKVFFIFCRVLFLSCTKP